MHNLVRKGVAGLPRWPGLPRLHLHIDRREALIWTEGPGAKRKGPETMQLGSGETRNQTEVHKNNMGGFRHNTGRPSIRQQGHGFRHENEWALEPNKRACIRHI